MLSVVGARMAVEVATRLEASKLDDHRGPIAKKALFPTRGWADGANAGL